MVFQSPTGFGQSPIGQSRPGLSRDDGEAIAPQHFQPPTPRELRAQAVHRLQIGIIGLAAMLLLVGLANIIMDRARVSETASGAPAAAAALDGDNSDAQAGDPLADIGVVPDLPDDSQPKSAANRPPSAARTIAPR